MKKLVRTTLLITVLLCGIHAITYAQERPDSVLIVNHDGKNLLRLNTDAGFVVRGTPDVGEIPAKGEGVRMMWFPARWAFRVGKVDSFGSTYWDLTNIGYGSVALGGNSRASGNHSFAANWATTASGAGAVAIGPDAWATGETALAMGPSSIANGLGSIVLGPSIADGTYAVAIGFLSSASGEVSVAIGKDAYTANRRGSIVLGDGCAVFRADSVYPTADNQVVMRGCGGIKLYTNQGLTQGVELAPGGSGWQVISDVNRKENFKALERQQREILERLEQLTRSDRSENRR